MKTGRRSLAEAAVVQTLMYRQSSLAVGPAGPLAWAFACGAFASPPLPPPFAPPPLPPRPPAPAVHVDPNVSAALTPSHFATGCGAFQRFCPVGGAAYGMPLKTRTLASLPEVPVTWPASILT